MQTTDWAGDAHRFYLHYHRYILNHYSNCYIKTSCNENIKHKDSEIYQIPKFFPKEKQRLALSLLQSSPLLAELDLSNYQDGPFAKLEEIRGWDVVLRRLALDSDTDCDEDPNEDEDEDEDEDAMLLLFMGNDQRMLTLLRRNIYDDIFPNRNHSNENEINQKKKKKEAAVGSDNDDSRNNIVVVSRKKWALIECARWSKGFYHQKEVIQKIQADIQAYDIESGRIKDISDNDNIHKPSSSLSSSNSMHTLQNTQNTQITFDVQVTGVRTSTVGRYVTLSTSTNTSSTCTTCTTVPIETPPKTAAKPGDILYSTTPYCTSPMTIGATSSKQNNNMMMACFHCCSDLSNKSITSSSTIRDLSFLCEQCGVSSISYCSVQCRAQHRKYHLRECPLLNELFCLVRDLEMQINRTSSNGKHVDNSQTSTQTESGGMAPFKALLVLRMALRAKSQPQLWQQLMDLECHREQHLEYKPQFAADAKTVSSWILQHLTESEINAIKRVEPVPVPVPVPSSSPPSFAAPSSLTASSDPIITLQNLFFFINVNAIGLGPDGVGIFPGMASMFNHSCHENTTHSWDYNDSDDNYGQPILCFRAVDDILPGMECTIGYTGSLELPWNERTMPLVKHKFFECQCIRCQQEKKEEGEKKEEDKKVEEKGEHNVNLTNVNIRITDMIQQWQKCTTQLQSLQSLQSLNSHKSSNDNDDIIDSQRNKATEIQIRRELCIMAETLFPRYFVTKGLCLEELAIAISEKQNQGNEDDRNKERNEMFSLLEKAREQYVICRGENSYIVKRVDQFIQSQNLVNEAIVLEKDINEDHSEHHLDFSAFTHVSNNDDDDDDDPSDVDINELIGWCETLFEVKTYEPLSVKELKQLSEDIRKLPFELENCIIWADGFRVYEVGYGILTVIISGKVNEAVISKYDISEMIQEKMEDVVQNIDVI